MKLPTLNLRERLDRLAKSLRPYTPIFFMLTFIGVWLLFMLFIIKYVNTDTVFDDEEMWEQQAKCESLNGTLMGTRIDRGEDMGLWTDLYCDFNRHPNEEVTDESGE